MAETDRSNLWTFQMMPQTLDILITQHIRVKLEEMFIEIYILIVRSVQGYSDPQNTE
jgi:hypothetical protein